MKKDFFNKYVKAVASHFNFTIEEMFVQSKRRDIVDARQILYYLCINLANNQNGIKNAT